MTTEQSKLADEIEGYVAACKNLKQMACYSLEGNEHQIVIAALRASPAVLDSVTVKALCEIIASKIYPALDWTGAFSNVGLAQRTPQKMQIVEAAQSIRALIGHPASKGEPVTSTSRAPKVRTSHHRNKEEAARLQKLVDGRVSSNDGVRK